MIYKLQVENLKKTYVQIDGSEIPVLQGLNISVRQGELFVLLGPSGCGKTTLLRILAGLEKANEGSVQIDGTTVKGPTKNCGMVFQKFTLFPWLTVSKNIAFGLHLNHINSSKCNNITEEYINLVDLNGFQNAYPNELSEGMKQRVAIARALAVQPQVLLMDEPFANLDVKTKWEMQDFVLDIRQKTGMTILFVTHNVEEGVFLGDEIAVLSPRPAHIVKKYNIPFGKNRDEGLKASTEFVQIESEMNRILRENIS
jgi:NitT/TauT family transport system ATP-binding protein